MNIRLVLIRSIHYILFFLILFFLLYSLLNMVVDKDASGQLLLRSFLEIAPPAVLVGLLYSFFVKRERKSVPIAIAKGSLRKTVLTAVSRVDCRICGESGSRMIFCHRSFWKRFRYIFDDKITITIHPEHLDLEGRSYLINEFLEYLNEESGSNPMQ